MNILGDALLPLGSPQKVNKERLMDELAISEGDLKSAVRDYLQILQNQGKLIFLQLNAGDFIEVRGNTRRRVRGCPAGTADYIVIRSCRSRFQGDSCILRLVDFIETKSRKGRQTPEQKEFQRLVGAQGCGYHLVRSLEELIAIIGDIPDD